MQTWKELLTARNKNSFQSIAEIWKFEIIKNDLCTFTNFDIIL